MIGLVENGVMSFRGVFVTELPKNFICKATLDLSDSDIIDLPEGLFVEGDLLLKNSKITSIPDKTIIKGSLDLTNTPVEQIGEYCHIGGDFIVNNATIKKLPKNIYVGGDIDMGEAFSLSSLPKGMIFGGVVKNNKEKKQNFYKTNKLYNHIVSCSCGKYFVFFNQQPYPVRYDHDGEVIEWAPFYISLDKKHYAVEYNKKYYYCNNAEEGEVIIQILQRDERISSSELDINKYTLDSKLDLQELWPIYQILTNCCDFAKDEFKIILQKLNLKETEKYSIAKWIWGSKKSSYKYNYLFTDFFENGFKKKKIITLNNEESDS